MTQSEFFREVDIDDLENGVNRLTLKATTEEETALAARFELKSVSGFTAEVSLRRVPPGHEVEAECRFSATIVQICVVSLEEFETAVSDRFDCRFSTRISDAGEFEVDIDPDGEDPPEPIIGGKFDIGGIIAEYFGLALEPFPRAPGVDFQDIVDDEGGSGDNPFAKLKERH